MHRGDRVTVLGLSIATGALVRFWLMNDAEPARVSSVTTRRVLGYLSIVPAMLTWNANSLWSVASLHAMLTIQSVLDRGMDTPGPFRTTSSKTVDSFSAVINVALGALATLDNLVSLGNILPYFNHGDIVTSVLGVLLGLEMAKRSGR